MTSSSCRVCGGALHLFLDLGPQPVSDAFVLPGETGGEFRYRLAVGRCERCTMVQQVNEVPRETMFHAGYPYHSSGSAGMRAHFAAAAEHLRREHLSGPDPFIVELGCNDGVMLHHLADAGIRHLGVEPSAGVAEIARERGLRVRTDFFDAGTARKIASEDGRADAVYAANTFCHIPYVDSIFQGLDEILRPHGVFVFEDPYLADVVERTSFDQIYDEHYFLFSATSVATMARRFGFELVDVERLPVHGGEVRYTLAREGARPASARATDLLAEEDASKVTGLHALEEFAGAVTAVCDDLTALLARLRSEGRTIVGYGATAKSATVTNFCGIGTDTIDYVCDSTPAKQGRLTPGMHIPVVGPEWFRDPYPDYALLFAWNHAAEIMRNEQAFADAGGRWIQYVPRVHVTGA